MHLLRVFNFESKQQADRLERVNAPVNIVAQEEVVRRVDVPALTPFAWELPDVEEPH